MNKDNLQKELKEKIKEGIKPSDLKKAKKKPNKKADLPPPIVQSEDEGYISEELSEEETVSRPERYNKEIPSNQETKNLQTKITALERQLQTYKDFKEADLKIKEKLKGEIEQWKKAVEKANTLIAEKEQSIKDLQQENKEQYKTISDMKSKGENTTNIKQELFICYNCKKQREISLLVLELSEGKLCQPCWQVFRKKTKEKVKETPKENKPFTCHNCHQQKQEKSFKVKLDSTLQEYFICSPCLPLIKEYNEKEADSERELDIWE